jgi:preprotein translocase subunit SecF
MSRRDGTRRDATRRDGAPFDGAEPAGADLAGAEPAGADLAGADPDGGNLEGGDEVQEEVTEDELVEDEVVRVAAKARGPRRVGPLRRVYRGETSFDFVGRRRWWFALSGVIILAGVVSLGFRGLDLGITFKGGTAWTVKAPGITQTQALAAVQAVGLSQPTVELLGSGSHQEVEVTADLNGLPTATQKAETTKVVGALAKLAKVPQDQVSVTTVGPTWGSQVTQKAVIALIVFLVLVAAYISIRFEPKMAIAAFVALLHDLLVTAGVYSLAGFQVTPDTVIAVLTILGYSLYDTVVVFDRVRDNTKGLGSSGRMTYSEMVNLSMNQTLARSINTSLVAIMPVLAVLLIGAELLGATTLQTYGLALFVGLCSGAYSSIFIASPILAILKEHEPRYVSIRQRIEAKGERLGLLTPSAAAALIGASGGGGGGRAARVDRTARPGALRPGQAKPARPGGGTASPRAATATIEPDRVVAGAASGRPASPPEANGRPANGQAANGRPTGGGRGAAARPRPGGRPPPRSRKGKGKRRR